MAKPEPRKETKRVNVFLITGEYDPIKQKPEDPRLIMNEGDFAELSKKLPGIQYLPKRWLEHENFQYDIPHLIMRGNILGMIVPSGEMERIRRIRERIVLLTSLPDAYPRHADLINALIEFQDTWENFQSAFKNLMIQLENAKRKEESLL
jgi:hypothetical protein